MRLARSIDDEPQRSGVVPQLVGSQPIRTNPGGRRMISAQRPRRISTERLKSLHRRSWAPNLKILACYALLGSAGHLAWTTSSAPFRGVLFVAMGYLWMSIVTFMHDCTHNSLFEARWKNWAFGIFSLVPLMVTFISFKRDHLAHHRYNRSAKDPDAFTMGRRRFLDFLLFYSYILVGGILTIVQFTFIYPIQTFDRRSWLIHGTELLLRVVVLGGLLFAAWHFDVLGRFLGLWLIPLYVFSLLNSVRFIAEHYETPWDEGQLLGTRTILSNPVNSFFWNNINYHIGHHVYPGVPWYNLQKLHAAMLPEIERVGGVIEPGYLGVFARACSRGPESPQGLLARTGRSDPQRHLVPPLPTSPRVQHAEAP
jgi:fatty acid desaturase